MRVRYRSLFKTDFDTIEKINEDYYGIAHNVLSIAKSQIMEGIGYRIYNHVVEICRKPIGVINYCEYYDAHLTIPGVSENSEDDYMLIQNLEIFVDKYKGLGYGMGLLKYTIKYIIRKFPDCKAIAVLVVDPEVLPFYYKCGFVKSIYDEQILYMKI